jgi:S-adenosylmethionine hydrolase
MPLITLTTDFGLASHYPAQMKASILGICPAAQIIDVSHGVRPQNIREGAVILADVTPQYPPGTIHVAVIDPGVGTQRAMIMARLAGQLYVLPDNGLLTPLLLTHGLEQAYYLRETRWWRSTVSATFHGRDILAPVSAHLAMGAQPSLLGPVCSEPVRIPWPTARRGAGRLLGEVLFVDSFGNLITNVSRSDVESLGPPQSLAIECCGIDVEGIQATYGLSVPGQTIALFDSHDRLEIAVVNGSAANLWQIAESAPVSVSISR